MRARRYSGIHVPIEIIDAVARPVGRNQDGDLCAVPGCYLPRRVMNVCRSHYNRWRAWRRSAGRNSPTQDLAPIADAVKPATWVSPRLSERRCHVTDCNSDRYHSRGLCTRHYHQWRRHVRGT